MEPIVFTGLLVLTLLIFIGLRRMERRIVDRSGWTGPIPFALFATIFVVWLLGFLLLVLDAAHIAIWVRTLSGPWDPIAYFLVGGLFAVGCIYLSTIITEEPRTNQRAT